MVTAATYLEVPQGLSQKVLPRRLAQTGLSQKSKGAVLSGWRALVPGSHPALQRGVGGRIE